jgi:hypothetical protein
MTDEFVSIKTNRKKYKIAWTDIESASVSNLVSLGGFLSLNIRKKDKPRSLSFVGFSDKNIEDIIKAINSVKYNFDSKIVK